MLALQCIKASACIFTIQRQFGHIDPFDVFKMFDSMVILYCAMRQKSGALIMLIRLNLYRLNSVNNIVTCPKIQQAILLLVNVADYLSVL
jgi:hypothetical protein